ncbi:2Fe-2S iron-sulfur cluster binding domain-containing protein [Hymenobacter taeanensis]|uniref:2Fe-2S iron-sulfur cluster binding domain-containing protein n=1 Tax=Hymenobacter taeanensis TaxID=2735321 RepID=A0A6M6BKE2_9BACT|nr:MULTISPECIES: FAD binding domain-containing protein [Hymenobacter]QJX47525.1 2Fe-2S iron-sulfur cluster binding domain-containing protein [Hymenobacter taeanensis]UOQ82991.1 FAD binding domain-containing protein [Hymenobacter sp. 5414T-23]
MLQFYLNDQLIRTTQPAGSTLLDFVRYNRHLTGTKIGCREGDCGACTVLVGELQPGGQTVAYQSMTSCLTPLGNAHGRHVVTVEGINAARGTLTPIQQAIVAEGGSQCGFCTVGFVMSLTGHSLSQKPGTPETALAAIDGNICRCTGYKSLERATLALQQQLTDRPTEQPLAWLAEQGFVPGYFQDIPAKLTALRNATETVAAGINQSQNGHTATVTGLDAATAARAQVLGGGTDLLVQRPEQLREMPVQLVYGQPERRGIRREGNNIVLGAATTAQELMESGVMRELLPRLPEHLKLVSSTPIRNMGTVAGNFINASPIGDLTILFLALGASITLEDTGLGQRRELPLQELYVGYKQLAKSADEQVLHIQFQAPQAADFFNFEKVSKRTHLDIASVNSAAWLRVQGGLVEAARLSAGGVGPIPLVLPRTAEFLIGREISIETVRGALELAQEEISPISDVRGTVQYKRLLLRQLLAAHFLQFFPEQLSLTDLL